MLHLSSDITQKGSSRSFSCPLADPSADGASVQGSNLGSTDWKSLGSCGADFLNLVYMGYENAGCSQFLMHVTHLKPACLQLENLFFVP